MTTGARRVHPVRRVVLALGTVLALAGCSSSDGLAGAPLPGGAGGGGYQVTIKFRDVLDLVPQAAVKVNDVTVGSVREIKLSGWQAAVRVQLNRDVKLPPNAIASIRQTSLLGEKFVDLSAPPVPPGGRPAAGRLSDGAVIPVSRTTENVEVEEVLGALSLVLNGGGLDKLRTINVEIGKITSGREPEIRDSLKQLDTFITGLDNQKKQIVRAITNLDTLSKELANQKTTIANAIDSLDPGVTVLAEQRKQLVGMLTALGKLGTVGTRVVQQSQADLVANLKSLQPILTQLVNSGDNLPRSIDQMLTYPFPPNITGAIVGDYVNLHATVDLNVNDILSNLFTTTPQGSDGTGQQPAGQSGLPSLLGPLLPLGPDGKPLPPGESNSQSGGLVNLLLGGLTR